MQPLTNLIDITNIHILAERMEIRTHLILIGEGILHRLRCDDEIEGVVLFQLENEFTGDREFCAVRDEIDMADVVFMQISDPAQLMRDRDGEGAVFELDGVVFPWPHHELMSAKRNLRRVLITRPVVDVNFHE